MGLLQNDNKTVPRLRQNDLANVKTDIGMKAWIVTPTLSYDVLEKNNFSLAFLAGARYLNMDVDLKVDVNEFRDPEASRSGTASGDVWDGIAGIKGDEADARRILKAMSDERAAQQAIYQHSGRDNG